MYFYPPNYTPYERRAFVQCLIWAEVYATRACTRAAVCHWREPALSKWSTWWPWSLRRSLQSSGLPWEPEQRHAIGRLLRSRQSHSNRMGKDQETEDQTAPLATSKTSRIIKPTRWAQLSLSLGRHWFQKPWRRTDLERTQKAAWNQPDYILAEPQTCPNKWGHLNFILVSYWFITSTLCYVRMSLTALDAPLPIVRSSEIKSDDITAVLFCNGRRGRGHHHSPRWFWNSDARIVPPGPRVKIAIGHN